MVSKRIGVDKLVSQIACLKYTLFCFSIITWLFGFALFVLSVWLRAEPGFEEWVRMLDIWIYYVGVYILIIAGGVVMITSFVGCCAALTESKLGLLIFIGSQVVCFLISIIGSAVLLDNSTFNSGIQPRIYNKMLDLIYHSEYEPWSSTLRLIQENVGCCGAEGPNDYMRLRQPLPIECRDTVTGNAYFNGCVDEIIWYLEDKSIWAATIGMALGFLHIINLVLGLIFVQAAKREEEVLYRR